MIRQDIVVLQEMLRGIREREFQEVIQILRKAGSVEIYGAERSAFVAGELEGRLCIWGFPAGRMQICFFKKVMCGISGRQECSHCHFPVRNDQDGSGGHAPCKGKRG